ncbi:hypothetical protein SEUCBS139899_008677 [Sporothrix eucalyptigena]|uniref:Bacteriophage T5 Orf172 DNA-binding domain-containing protein n=1 Tax=Sporothrix eucalyptigena TaxID=1812306 RepID=A0ABP0CPJ6_9PEZI
MPFIANTPESLVARSDSKNPATTCRGITSGGRPCRRPIAASDIGQKSLGGGRGGKLRVDDPRDENLYCWQHKEQASMSARSSPGPRASATPILEERTSLDTLADRLNLLSMNTGRSEKHKSRKHGGSRPSDASGGEWARPRPRPQQPPKTTSFCCCFSLPIEEPLPPARPRPRPIQSAHSTAYPATAYSSPGSAYSATGKGKHVVVRQSHTRTSSSGSHSYRVQGGGGGGSRRPSTASQTAQYLSLILPTATPQTASALMAELAKPISQLDEPGYIYMFWLTPESQQATPPADAARSLLAPPSRSAAGADRRRASDVVASFAGGGSSGGDGTRDASQTKKSPGTLLLKIGRANNVHRRLNEWKRQCGYNLSLLRYYPYIPSSSNSSPDVVGGGIVPRKMPHSHKVERLIHIELAGAGLRVADGDKCEVCGREHREWFQVEATRKAVAAVDEVIRRWADWDEGRL